MKHWFGRIISVLLIVVVLLCHLSFNIVADIAPMQVVGTGSSGIFVHQSNITLERFFVNVSVDLPQVHEEYVYVLRNDQNQTINQTVMIPVFFEYNKWAYYSIENSSLQANGKKIAYFESNISLTEYDLIVDMEIYSGYAANVTFQPLDTMRIELIIDSIHESFTESFYYFYTAKTSRYWNGSIAYGSFKFEYLSKYESIDFDVPNGIMNEATITSVMSNWDGNSTYSITVDTWGKYQPIPRPLALFVWVAILVLITGSIVLLSVWCFYRRRQRRKPSKEEG